MRMWMVDPGVMCDRHLLGEHAETHMLAGTLARGRSIDGFIANDLLEPSSLVVRHERLACEMAERGFRHVSPLPDIDLTRLPERSRTHEVDVARSFRELTRRCETCRARAARKP